MEGVEELYALVGGKVLLKQIFTGLDGQLAWLMSSSDKQGSLVYFILYCDLDSLGVH